MKKFYVLLAISLLAGRISAQGPVSYSVEKDIIHSFLTDFDYDTIPLTVSKVMTYFNMPHKTDAGKPATDPVNRLDVPSPVKLSWEHQEGATAQRVEIWDASADTVSFTIDKDASEYDLYNMIPGVSYQYQVISVKDGAEQAVKTGQLAPTGMLRWIYAEGTWNVRDMGGWTGLGGKPIKYGQLFRGGQLTNPNSPYDILLTEKGIEAIRNAGIRAELDLRSSSQAHYSNASFAKKNAQNKYDADFTNIATTSARMWQYDKDESNIKAIQWAINELKAGKPVFYHCQNGADRTGTVGFLIGALLGMSESDLAKDYELTTFCQEAAVAFDATEVGFARLRNYEGKKGSVDRSSDPKDYMFAPLIDKLNTVSGPSIQRKIYDFLRNGKNGTKISANDLIWFINYMTGYIVVDDITIEGGQLITLDKGQQKALNATISPENATKKDITYSSGNPNIATVTAEGLITAVSCGQTTITIRADDCIKTVSVNVPLIESKLPASVKIGDQTFEYKSSASNKVKDGSFEYGSFFEWMTAKDTAMTSKYFSLTKYSQNADSVYLESKIDGDEKSEGSIRMEWTTPKNRAFVFGFRVKNSTNLTTTKNENLKIILTNDDKADDDPAGYIFEYPSYDGNWKEIQYVFETTTRNRLRILFTHLSQNGNNTCFDNFYLMELANVPEGATFVNTVKDEPRKMADNRIYNLSGQEVTNPGPGIYIRNGKKYLIR